MGFPGTSGPVLYLRTCSICSSICVPGRLGRRPQKGFEKTTYLFKKKLPVGEGRAISVKEELCSVKEESPEGEGRRWRPTFLITQCLRLVDNVGFKRAI